jgi:uncharacterized protein (TIGR02271 family)
MTPRDSTATVRARHGTAAGGASPLNPAAASSSSARYACIPDVHGSDAAVPCPPAAERVYRSEHLCSSSAQGYRGQGSTGRARLRKYVVTENVTKTVPVKKEKVRVEREPITEQNRGKAMAGPDISEEEHEVTLTEEEPVVEKRAVPKERVRLEKDVEQQEQQVTEQVRKERIKTDGADDELPAR